MRLGWTFYRVYLRPCAPHVIPDPVTSGLPSPQVLYSIFLFLFVFHKRGRGGCKSRWAGGCLVVFHYTKMKSEQLWVLSFIHTTFLLLPVPCSFRKCKKGSLCFVMPSFQTMIFAESRLTSDQCGNHKQRKVKRRHSLSLRMGPLP